METVTEMKNRLGQSPTNLGDWELNPRNYILKIRDKAVRLTPVELSLVMLFMRYPGDVFSAAELKNRVWGPRRVDSDEALVRVTIRKLREKLEDDPSAPHYIRTLERRGYYLNPDRGSQ